MKKEEKTREGIERVKESRDTVRQRPEESLFGIGMVEWKSQDIKPCVRS